jgi:1,2-diacylglycerol 3-alpha-glucosyltransferase
VIMMDDAWEHTDQRGAAVTLAKRLIAQNIDGAFVPAPSHRDYFVALGVPAERIVFGVDVVDNGYFSELAGRARDGAGAGDLRQIMHLPERYFLFVGRMLPRKGLKTLLTAYARYRGAADGDPWGLVLVGGGEMAENGALSGSSDAGVHVAGPQFGEDLCRYYGLATVLIVPSDSDPWALVVNEGMAAGLPVFVSRGCGAARTLVREAENGWTFEPGDEKALASLMQRVTLLSDTTLKEMGRASRTVIARWSLDRFADGVLAALRFERRPPSGLLSRVALAAWKGRVRVT